MLRQANIAIFLRVLRKNWKNMGMLRFVPLLVLNVLIPLVNALSYKQYGVQQAFEEEIRTTALLLIPFFAGWWPTVILKEYIEAKGNELYSVFINQKVRLCLVPVCLLYLMNVSVLFFGYIKLFPALKLLYVWVLLLCFFFFGLSYCLSFLTKSTTLTFMAALLYTMLNHIKVYDRVTFLVYSSAGGIQKTQEWRKVYLPILALSVVLLLAGTISKSKHRSYN